jgi:hypothetical protein
VSRYKGGTLVDESVGDLATHARRVSDPDGYRPVACPRCGHRVLHVHSYPERRARGEPGAPPAIPIVQYICASADCAATWRVLPKFLARHLWRVWATVERQVVTDAPVSPAPTIPIPPTTRRRWSARLAAAARVVVVLFAASGGAMLEGIAMRVGVDATRGELAVAYGAASHAPHGERLAAIAAHVHRLERGVRLM